LAEKYRDFKIMQSARKEGIIYNAYRICLYASFP